MVNSRLQHSGNGNKNIFFQHESLTNTATTVQHFRFEFDLKTHTPQNQHKSSTTADVLNITSSMEAENNFLSKECQNFLWSTIQYKQNYSIVLQARRHIHQSKTNLTKNKNTTQFTWQSLSVLAKIRQDIIRCNSGEAKNTEENISSTKLSRICSSIQKNRFNRCLQTASMHLSNFPIPTQQTGANSFN